MIEYDGLLSLDRMERAVETRLALGTLIVYLCRSHPITVRS